MMISKIQRLSGIPFVQSGLTSVVKSVNIQERKYTPKMVSVLPVNLPRKNLGWCEMASVLFSKQQQRIALSVKNTSGKIVDSDKIQSGCFHFVKQSPFQVYLNSRIQKVRNESH